MGWINDALWRLDELCTRWIHRRQVRIRGACTACGECCRSLLLTLEGRPVRTEQDFERLLERDPFTYSRFVPTGADSDGDWRFRCSKLAEDGRCSVHAERPVICRAYPHPRMFLQGARLPEACGYQAIILVQDIRRDSD